MEKQKKGKHLQSLGGETKEKEEEEEEEEALLVVGEDAGMICKVFVALKMINYTIK